MTALGDTMTTDDTPRVWVGCLACYNEDRLTGEWVDAVDAAESVPCERPSHEEFWCMDTENLPVSGELSPMEAARIGAAIESVDDVPTFAAAAYIANIGATSVDWDTLADDVREAYCGLWDSFRAYAEELADDIGLLSEAPEDLARYFDWDAWTRDLGYDYWSSDYDVTAGGYHVFRSV